MADISHVSACCRLRLQAENAMGKGPFSGYVSASTLPPPPPPPTLSLTSVTPYAAKLSWGKKSVKGTTYVLQMATEGKS